MQDEIGNFDPQLGRVITVFRRARTELVGRKPRLVLARTIIGTGLLHSPGPQTLVEVRLFPTSADLPMRPGV